MRNAGGTVYCYDANGNMASRAGASISWTSYNLPSQINQTGGNSSQFWYGANRQRYKQVNVNGSTTTTTIYAGKLLEKLTTGSVTDYKHYVRAVGQTVALHIRSSTSTNSTYYPLKDHLGSIDRLTNSSGSVVVALSYDAFGKRRGSNWTGSPTSGDLSNIAATTRHGFTEHEHLDNLTLVHMNGRVYDPAIGRFISADPFVQSLCNAQSLNRYSYVWNNPLSYTDPSGFERTTRPRLPVPDNVPELGEMDVTERAPGGGGYAGFYGGGDPRADSRGGGERGGEDARDLGEMDVTATPITPPTVDVPDPSIAAPTFAFAGLMAPTLHTSEQSEDDKAERDRCVKACVEDRLSALGDFLDTAASGIGLDNTHFSAGLSDLESFRDTLGVLLGVTLIANSPVPGRMGRAPIAGPPPRSSIPLAEFAGRRMGRGTIIGRAGGALLGRAVSVGTLIAADFLTSYFLTSVAICEAKGCEQ